VHELRGGIKNKARIKILGQISNWHGSHESGANREGGRKSKIGRPGEP